MTEEKDLIEELFLLLAPDSTDAQNINSKVDYSKLLDLSTKISEFDKENVRFSVDAKIVERLGEQLVAKKTTALSELIKNAYDADAESVTVHFAGTEAPGGKITIVDDGIGMTFDGLVSGFMTISTSDKLRNPLSTRYERPRAGKKGIGRFSVQKIGRRLKLVTKQIADDHHLCVDIDWDKFQSGAKLSSIANRIYSDEENYDFDEGTILEISDVREAWTSSNIETTYKYLASILSIGPVNTKDPGFKAVFNYTNAENKSSSLTTIDQSTEFLDKADLKACATMESDGRLKVEIVGIADKRNTDTLYFDEGFDENLRNTDYKVEFHYFSRGRGADNSRALTNYLASNGGLKLKRNGFSVAPYGSRGNDWLGLDDSNQKRKYLMPHSNTNFIGVVSVVDNSGNIFEETSAREGLIENDAFDRLATATYYVAIKVAAHNAEIRERKITANQDFVSRKKSKEIELQEQLEEMKIKLAAQSESNGYKKEKQSEGGDDYKNSEFESDEDLNSQLIESLETVTETLKEYIDEQLMYRVLSSTGLAISEFTHEIQTCLTNLSLNSQTLERLSILDPQLKSLSSQLEENLSLLIAYTDFFDGTMRSNSNREKNNYDMQKLVKKFVQAMKPTVERRGYKLSTYFDDWGIWTKPVHISEIMSIFMNLFTNSCKAIERAGSKAGEIRIEVFTGSSFMTIKFQDNGDGIPKDKWARVFSPLYTTSMPAKPFSKENEYNRGMGLGLSITENIIDEMNGEIAIDEPSDGFNTCVKITLPLASESELPEDAY